jgi:hypothetical protein
LARAQKHAADLVRKHHDKAYSLCDASSFVVIQRLGITDAISFCGSDLNDTGPCIGHVSPEALAGGPLGKLRDGDRVRVEVDTRGLRGSIDLVRGDESGGQWVADDAEPGLRSSRPDLAPDPDLPDATRLWAAFQTVSGGVWGGAVYDVDKILGVLEAGHRALARAGREEYVTPVRSMK